MVTPIRRPSQIDEAGRTARAFVMTTDMDMTEHTLSIGIFVVALLGLGGLATVLASIFLLPWFYTQL